MVSSINSLCARLGIDVVTETSRSSAMKAGTKSPIPTPKGKYFCATNNPSCHSWGRSSFENSNRAITPASSGLDWAKIKQIGTANSNPSSAMSSPREVNLIHGRSIQKLAKIGMGNSAIPIREEASTTANAHMAMKMAEIERTQAGLSGILRAVTKPRTSSGTVISAMSRRSAVALLLAWKPVNAGVSSP